MVASLNGGRTLSILVRRSILLIHSFLFYRNTVFVHANPPPRGLGTLKICENERYSISVCWLVAFPFRSSVSPSSRPHVYSFVCNTYRDTFQRRRSTRLPN